MNQTTMTRVRRLALLLLLLSGLPAAGQAPPAPIRSLEPTVILISLDGVRHDYLRDHADATPTLQRLAREGVRAQALLPVFPTKTFPSHYSMVTGLYPENHGIVSNSIWDPQLPGRFSLSNREEAQRSAWWQGEPIWVTAERQGKRTAAMFWPGSDVEIAGHRPSFWKPYDREMPNAARVEQVLAWLDLPRPRRPQFITLYFSTVDSAGHQHGPGSPQTVAALRHVDRMLEQLVSGLEQRRVLDRVNLIVVSDHGMSPTSRDRVIFLDDILDLADADVIDWNPLLMVRSRSGDDERIYRALEKARAPWAVYRKQDAPQRWRLKNHRRVPPVLALADEGWTITTRKRFHERPEDFPAGMHGYDNALSSQWGIFVARGPAFRRGATVAPFESVHLYELMSRILRLKPAPNDGSLRAVRHLLR